MFQVNFQLFDVRTNRYYATQAIIENYSELVNQFSYKSIPKEEIIHRPIKIDKKGPCLSTNVFIKPIRMPSINGNWRVIVQDAKDIIQRERIVLCTRAGDVCQMPPEKLFAPLQCHTSRCSQKFIVRQLLAYDPCDPTRGIFVDSFKIPSACSCLFSRSTCWIKGLNDKFLIKYLLISSSSNKKLQQQNTSFLLWKIHLNLGVKIFVSSAWIN